MKRGFSVLKAKVIPHGEQRYNTLGDYSEDDCYRISDMKNAGYHVAILVHEIVEWELCKMAGIKEKDISSFDIEFEKLKKGDGEPGDSPLCPYRDQHQKASDVERAVIGAFGLSWMEYGRACGKVTGC